MGIPACWLLVGALPSSATARLHDPLHCGGTVLRIKKGDNMKLVLGITGAAAILIGGAAFGIQANAMQEQAQTSAVKAPLQGRPVAGYEGWWNSTPASGSSAALPQETVAVNTRTGKIVDAFNRTTNSTARHPRRGATVSRIESKVTVGAEDY